MLPGLFTDLQKLRLNWSRNLALRMVYVDSRNPDLFILPVRVWYHASMTKTKAADFKVPDAAEAMRKTGEAIKRAFAMPKTKIDEMLAKERRAKKKRG
jgi:hypothetical protein